MGGIECQERMWFKNARNLSSVSCFIISLSFFLFKQTRCACRAATALAAHTTIMSDGVALSLAASSSSAREAAMLPADVSALGSGAHTATVSPIKKKKEEEEEEEGEEEEKKEETKKKKKRRQKKKKRKRTKKKREENVNEDA